MMLNPGQVTAVKSELDVVGKIVFCLATIDEIRTWLKTELDAEQAGQVYQLCINLPEKVG